MTPFYADDAVTLWHGDALAVLGQLDAGSADCVVTSPPYYGLRDYGDPAQYGMEPTPADYVQRMVNVFRELRRVLTDDGTLWLNLGDAYSSRQGAQGEWRVGEYLTRGKGKVAPSRNRNGTASDIPAKNLLGIPWRVAFALQNDGWILRNAVIWAKPNAMPESVTDRLATRYEHVFLFTKTPRYWFDLDSIRLERAADNIGITTNLKHLTRGDARYALNPQSMRVTGTYKTDGRNPGDVWPISTAPFPDAHFAVMPPALAHRCIAAGCKPGGIVLDPFSGVGTTGYAAARLGRRYVGIDISADYHRLAIKTRLGQPALIADEEAAMTEPPNPPPEDAANYDMTLDQLAEQQSTVPLCDPCDRGICADCDGTVWDAFTRAWIPCACKAASHDD